ETRQVIGGYRQHITFLRLVTPDRYRAHARFVIGNAAQLQRGATVGIMHQFRQRIGQAASAHVVDGNNRVALTERPATVNHFLATALDFRVVALHRGKVELLGAFAGRHRRGSTTTETDQHRRATEHDDFCTGRNALLLDMLLADIAEATGDHDRLVVAAHFIAVDTRRLDFQRAEITTDIRATEFVVERGATNRALDHDVECRDNTRRLAVVTFPRLFKARDVQVGDREAGEA